MQRTLKMKESVWVIVHNIEGEISEYNMLVTELSPRDDRDIGQMWKGKYI